MRKNAIVAGTGFEGRARIVRAHCKVGRKVILQREPMNRHDPNAIAVYLEVPRFMGLLGVAHKQIGFVKANAAKSLAEKMDDGMELRAKVASFWAPHNIEHPRVSLEITDET